MPATSRPGNRFAEIVQQKALARADVEHAHARLDAVSGDHGVRDLAPAAVIFVAAIAGFAAAIPVVVVELDRHLGDLGLVALRDAREIVAFGGLVNQADKLTIGHEGSLLPVVSRDGGLDFGYPGVGLGELLGGADRAIGFTGKCPPRRIEGHKIIQDDAGPFDVITVRAATRQRAIAAASRANPCAIRSMKWA